MIWDDRTPEQIAEEEARIKEENLPASFQAILGFMFFIIAPLLMSFVHKAVGVTVLFLVVGIILDHLKVEPWVFWVLGLAAFMNIAAAFGVCLFC